MLLFFSVLLRVGILTFLYFIKIIRDIGLILPLVFLKLLHQPYLLVDDIVVNQWFIFVSGFHGLRILFTGFHHETHERVLFLIALFFVVDGNVFAHSIGGLLQLAKLALALVVLVSGAVLLCALAV